MHPTWKPSGPVVACLALWLGACDGPASPPLEVVAFEARQCSRVETGGDLCYRLRLDIPDIHYGGPICLTYALADDGSLLEVGPVITPPEFGPHRSVTMRFRLPKVDDPAFTLWEPECVWGEG